MELVGLIFTALVLLLLGLAVWFGYLLLTSRASLRRAEERWARSGRREAD